MQEAVSDILSARAREADGIMRMMLVSLFAHATLIAFVTLMPASWRSQSAAPETKPMMISLAGAPGPVAGGMTPISGKAVQEVAPPAPPRVEPPPAPKAPEMVAPEPAKTAPKLPPKKIDKPADKSSARRPTTGPEIKSGAAASDTKGAPPIPFGGLTTGGGSGNNVRLETNDFCCPGYVTTMLDLIRQNWNRNQGSAGRVQVKFTILRDGLLTKVEVENGSNVGMLELEAQRAILKTRQLPPLPREYPDSTLTVHLIFEYLR